MGEVFGEDVEDPRGKESGAQGVARAVEVADGRGMGDEVEEEGDPRRDAGEVQGVEGLGVEEEDGVGGDAGGEEGGGGGVRGEDEEGGAVAAYGREGEGEVRTGCGDEYGAGGAGVGGGVGKEGEVEDEVAEVAGAEPDEGEAVLPCAVEFPAVVFEPLGVGAGGETVAGREVDGLDGAEAGGGRGSSGARRGMWAREGGGGRRRGNGGEGRPRGQRGCSMEGDGRRVPPHRTRRAVR